MNKNKEFIREIKINKKKRLRYNVVTLIFLNFLLLLSLVYMCGLLKNWFVGIVGSVMFVGCLFGSARTILNAKENRKYVIYRDKITIQSSTLDAEIPLKNVFMVKKRKSFFEYIFKRDAHMVFISVKNPHNQFYMLPFIDEDVNFLVDEIMELAISARLVDKEQSIQNTAEQTNVDKKRKANANKQTLLEQFENVLTGEEPNLVLKTAEENKKSKSEQKSSNLKSDAKNSKFENTTKQIKADKKSK